MPRLALLLSLSSLLALAPGCRCGGEGPTPPPAASARPLPSPATSAAPSASGSSPLPAPLTLGAPWSAVRSAEGWVAVGVPREGDGLLALRAGADGAPEPAVLQGSPALGRPTALDLVASKGGLALHIEDRQGKGFLWRAPSWDALRAAAPEPHGASLCALEDRLLAVVNGETPALRSWPFAGGDPALVLELKDGASSLYCGASRAYLLVDDGKQRRLFAVDRAGTRGPISLDGKENERGLAFAVEQDTLWISKIDASLRPSLRRWPASAPAPDPWIPLDERLDEGSSLDLLLPRADAPRVALVVGRHTDADDCKNGENFHTVAELLLFDLEKRALARPKVKIDTWLCGAEAGPFGGGASAKGFVVSWPRGVGAGCAKQGARYGGLGYVEVPLEGAPRAGKVELPSWDLLDLGCEGGRCGAVALARGEDGACWAADDARNNQPRWVAYP